MRNPLMNETWSFISHKLREPEFFSDDAKTCNSYGDRQTGQTKTILSNSCHTQAYMHGSYAPRVRITFLGFFIMT